MFNERTSLRLDGPARSVAVAAIDGVTGGFSGARLVPDPAEVFGWISALPGPVAAVYESGSTGLGRGPAR